MGMMLCWACQSHKAVDQPYQQYQLQYYFLLEVAARLTQPSTYRNTVVTVWVEGLSVCCIAGGMFTPSTIRLLLDIKVKFVSRVQ